MILIPQFGTNILYFGMLSKDVFKHYGAPSKKTNDDEDNEVWLYYEKQLKVTFYKEENHKMGYLVCSHPELLWKDNFLLGKTQEELQLLFIKHGIPSFEIAEQEEVTTWFNEDNWLLLHFEFNKLTKVEWGAIIKNEDEFDWKYIK